MSQTVRTQYMLVPYPIPHSLYLLLARALNQSAQQCMHAGDHSSSQDRDTEFSARVRAY